MKNLLEFEPIQKFIKAVGPDIERYFGKDPGCIIYLQPDGIFYAQGLLLWLNGRGKKDLALCTMADDGEGLEEGKVRGKKVLIVDNDVISGKSYKRSMEALRSRKEKLAVKDIKFATFLDRPGLTDFFVERYSAESIWKLEELDALDHKIISLLSHNGRMSFAEIGKDVRLSAVAIKHRVDKLLRANILKIQGRLNTERFYELSAGIQIECEGKNIEILIGRLRKKHEVYHIAKRSGKYNLTVSILVQNIEDVEEFIENEIRSQQGVRQIEVHVGELPIIPKTFSLPIE
ncbi:MAG: AsnC family transcriptional regulator [bacterium]|nr:AsnC family transcriptional regulator [bacterium]